MGISAHVGVLALTLGLLTACSIDRSSLSLPGARLDGGPGTGCSSARDCPRDHVCTRGSCVPRDEDADGDGIPAARDCDDRDRGIASSHEIPCTGPCGAGLERCADGVWAPCDAPTDCTCIPGQVRDLPCPMCGTQGQLCDAAGTWQDEGACEGAGECGPMEVETGTQPCGNCGTESISRTCTSTCAFGDWVVSGPCTGEGICAAGTPESRDEACGTCRSGTTTGTRVCEDSCNWSPWSWSGCMDEALCTDRFGRPICPGFEGTTRAGCPAGQVRWCTCGPDGDWTGCRSCFGG